MYVCIQQQHHVCMYGRRQSYIVLFSLMLSHDHRTMVAAYRTISRDRSQIVADYRTMVVQQWAIYIRLRLQNATIIEDLS